VDAKDEPGSRSGLRLLLLRFALFSPFFFFFFFFFFVLFCKDTLCFTIADFLSQAHLPAASEWGWKLEELGVSSESFHPDADLFELTKVLVEEGIPRIPAADIVRSAARFFTKQHKLAEKPLAIFWDAENVRIPADLSARNAYERMRKTLSRFGVPRDLFVYQDPSSGVSADTRGELQACGWLCIDTPHIKMSGGNAKEVADKMIIVDALLYCMNHQSSGATLCLITSDRDFSYLLSKLRGFPEIRTVVVHNAIFSGLLLTTVFHGMTC
jgi:hypothetical protein